MKGEITIRQPDEKELEEVKRYVEEFWLDNDNMLKEQFRILLYQGKLAAFGRLRVKEDSTELCTLGVIDELRNQGLGRAMVNALVTEAGGIVYVVSVIPEFFSKVGFVQVNEYPHSISKKYKLCSTEYVVEDPYVVMRYNK
jgi:N-acetylglutamate synthase-like GNAT family acetyltransferase